MTRLTLLALCAALVTACAAPGPASTAAPSSITSNNGGGERALGNQVSVGVTTRVQ